MRRGDATVMSVTAVLSAVVVAAVAFSLLGLDRKSSAVVSDNSNSSWLVTTWGPSFCQVEPSQPLCLSGEFDRMGPTLLLHGLWPQPEDNQYCGLTQLQVERARKGETELPALELSDDVFDELRSVTVNSTDLASHEWYAHGTCAGVTPDVYFSDAVTLTDALREVLDPVFSEAAGGRVTLSGIRERIEERFGVGTGDRVALGCRNAPGEGNVVVEVRLSLPPVAALHAVDDSLALDRLLTEAAPIEVDCRQGRVP